ncbi:MAG: thioredoxin family protein [Lentisphaeraceae bacterium]|nr:thioredoxin family protein [Lentisphaeraceae bacterium]
MKPILMMVMAGCPHCRHARELMDQLFKEHPIYADIPLRIVDETEEPAFAETLDYYYVPTFFVGDQKMHEGVPTREAIEAVFLAALKD